MNSHPREKQQPDDIYPSSTALFLDFDGTLVEIAARPDAVVLGTQMRDALAVLHDALDGALAIVSGRPVSELNTFLKPLKLPLAGVHGLEIQHADGAVERHAFDAEKLGRVLASVRAFAAPYRGLLVEAKAGAVALHYRNRPDLETEAKAFAFACSSAETGVDLVHGKMVAELRLGGRSKADAVTHFMSEPPFAGRTPWFIGDDVTDEDGFRRVNELGGHSVKIGSGDTAATKRFADIADFHSWLAATARHYSRSMTCADS